MKALRRPALFLILAALLLPLEMGAQPYPDDIQGILDRKKIRVAMIAAEYPPLIFTGEDGLPRGIEVRFAEDIASELGVALEYIRKARTFDEVIREVARHEADIGISYLSVTPRRARMVYFSEPYLILHQALLINRRLRMIENEKNPGQNIRDTASVIGVMAQSAYVKMLPSEFPRASLREYGSFEDLVGAAERGDVFAVLSDDFLLTRHVRQNPGAALNVEILVLENLRDYIAVAVHPDSPHLVPWLNIYLRSRNMSLTTRQLLEYGTDGAAERGP